MEFYKKSKCGLDVADQMARQYSVKAHCCFLQHSGFGRHHAFVLYKKKQVTRFQRRDFFFKLELRKDQAKTLLGTQEDSCNSQRRSACFSTKHGRIPIRVPLRMPVRGQNFSTSAGQNPPTCPENYPQQNQSRKNSANAKK